MRWLWLIVAAIVARASVAAADDAMTFEQAIQLALSRNERAKISDLDAVSAEAAVDRARVAFLPVLAATGAYTVRPVDKPVNLATGQVQLSQPIFAPSAFPLYDQAKHALDAQRAQTIEDKRQLAFDTAHAFFAVLLAQRVAEAAQKKLDTATADVADTDAQFKAQLVSSNDVTRAELSRSGSIRDLAADKGSYDAALVQLAYIVNAATPKQLATPSATLTAGKQPVVGLDDLVKDGIARRPDLAVKRHSAIAAHDFAREPRWRYLPSVGFLGQLSATSHPANGADTIDGSLGLNASWTIYDGGARSADAASRDAAAEIADLETQMTIRQVESDVRTAAAQLVSAQASLIGAQDAVDSSRKSADETAILYRQGLAKAIELVDANEQRFESEVDYAEAEFAVATAYLALRQALGEGPLEDAKK